MTEQQIYPDDFAYRLDTGSGGGRDQPTPAGEEEEEELDVDESDPSEEAKTN